MKKSKAIINQISENEIDGASDILQSAGNMIRNGGTVIFPTETVYGLGANALDPRAAQRIYKAKGRPMDNPLIVHIADEKMLEQIAKDISPEARLLMKAFWPGPLTMIFYKKDIVPSQTTGGLETVAVRFPSNIIARRLIESAEVPIAAPSANISGKPSITSGKYAEIEMQDRVDMIILSEDSNIGIESTVVDMTTALPVVLRPGKISQVEILRCISKDEKDFLQKLEAFDAMMESREDFSSAPKSPGMKYKHYSPDARIFLMKSEEILQRLSARADARSKKADTIKEQETAQLENHRDNPANVQDKKSDESSAKDQCTTREVEPQDYLQALIESLEDEKIRVFTVENNKNMYGSLAQSLGQDPEEIGKNLFTYLRDMDEQGVEVILFEELQLEKSSEFLSAIMNRIRKAAENVDF